MESSDVMEIDLRDIFQIVRKRIWIIVIVTLITSLTAAIISFFYITPIYESSTQLLVNKSQRDTDNIYNLSDINTNLKLVDTYSVIIKSPRIMELVIRDLGLELNAHQLTSKVKVSPVRNSQVISITVQDRDQHVAAAIANGIANIFKTEIINIMNVDNVQILTEARAETDPVPVKPKPQLNIMIAFVAGLMLSLGIVFLIEFFDQSIHTEKDVERLLNLPVLGSIPGIEESTRNLPKISYMSSSSTQGGTKIVPSVSAAGSELNEKK